MYVTCSLAASVVLKRFPRYITENGSGGHMIIQLSAAVAGHIRSVQFKRGLLYHVPKLAVCCCTAGLDGGTVQTRCFRGTGNLCTCWRQVAAGVTQPTLAGVMFSGIVVASRGCGNVTQPLQQYFNIARIVSSTSEVVADIIVAVCLPAPVRFV